jgi:hypothetical protein
VTVSFEPGDGSFEVLLSETDPIPVEWVIPAAIILRSSPDGYRVVKPLGSFEVSE